MPSESSGEMGSLTSGASVSSVSLESVAQLAEIAQKMKQSKRRVETPVPSSTDTIQQKCVIVVSDEREKFWEGIVGAIFVYDEVTDYLLHALGEASSNPHIEAILIFDLKEWTDDKLIKMNECKAKVKTLIIVDHTLYSLSEAMKLAVAHALSPRELGELALPLAP